ncbi:MAG: DNRLRE domain-containing protein [Phycisphaerae bacterium]|nr:DNRLRE domain-containing protein [Phycisphaerae bacterium]
MMPTRNPNHAPVPGQPSPSPFALVTAMLSCVFAAAESRAESVKIYPVADNWMSSCASGCTANYGDDPELRVRTAVWSCDVKNFRSLLQFDMSDLPGDPNEIGRVTLGLYFYTSHNGDPTRRVYEVRRVTNPWTEPGSTWQCRSAHNDPNIRIRWDDYLAGVPAYQPGGGDYDANVVYALSEVPPVGNWMTWDVTGLVMEWCTGTHDNFGLMIKDADEYDDPNLYWTDSPLAQFRSREHYDQDFWPYLEIVPPDYRLTLTEVNGRWGTVELNPQPDDPNTPSYPPDTEVTLTAVPIEGRAFSKWIIFDPNFPGDANHATEDANSVTTIVMMADRRVEASFKCGSGLDVMLPLLGSLLAVAGLRSVRNPAR